MRTTYNECDCKFLLKNLSSEVREITIEEKEELIRQGINYSEMISKENIPSEKVTTIFKNMLNRDKVRLAYYVAKISEQIYREKGHALIIVSLARAGTPYGILIKRYLKLKYNIEIPHYSLSIIRGKGIDKNALKFILNEHKECKIQFIDGWTGKGSITKELNKSIKEFNQLYKQTVDSELAVISDPARLCRIYGTREDFGLANCCLNATVSGLISRSIHNEQLIGEHDFHGAKYLEYLKEYDYSNYFIDVIADEFNKIIEQLQSDKNLFENEMCTKDNISNDYAEKITNEVKEKYKVKSKNNIKLSVGETARVLLRRSARLIIVKNFDNENIEHIIQLAKERNVKVVKNSNIRYNCISIIKE